MKKTEAKNLAKEYYKNKLYVVMMSAFDTDLELCEYLEDEQSLISEELGKMVNRISDKYYINI